MDHPQTSCKEQLGNICIQQLQKLHWNIREGEGGWERQVIDSGEYKYRIVSN